jgi:FkbM family methyltransferase
MTSDDGTAFPDGVEPADPTPMLRACYLLGRLSPLRRYCHRFVGWHLGRYPEKAVVLGRMSGLPTVLDLRETMERTIFLAGAVNRREIALMRWALRTVDRPVVFDIGANVGNHSVGLRDIAGTIYAFEPNPLMHQRLVWTIARSGVDNIVPVQLALSDRSGHGWLETDNRGIERGTLARKDKGGLPVEVATGDAFAARRRLTRLDLVKIDVEGHEPQVLRGLAATIERFRPIVVFERYVTSEEHAMAALHRLLHDYLLIGTRKRRAMVGAPAGVRLERFDDARAYPAVLAVPKERRGEVLGRRWSHLA